MIGGKQTISSDVDLLYDLEHAYTLGVRELDEFEHYVKELLSVNKVDLIDRRFLNAVIPLEIQEHVLYI